LLIAVPGRSSLGLVNSSPSWAGYVFFDASLPTPGLSWMDTAPEELSSALVCMAHDGWLPPWFEWFGENAIVELLPDSAMREAFIEDRHELPLTRCSMRLVQLPHLGRMLQRPISDSVMRTHRKPIKRERCISRCPCWNRTIWQFSAVRLQQPRPLIDLIEALT
jgi:hypothetical protein